MREKYRKSIASLNKFPQFTTMNVIDGQAGLISYASLIFYSLTIDNILNIIVLLILAGVTIATLTGNNGILTKANEAKESTEVEKEKELIELAVVAAKTKNQGELTTENLDNELKINMNNEEKVIESTLGWRYKATLHNYIISKEGNVTIEGQLPNEYQEVEYLESSGKQYIDSGVPSQVDLTIKAEIASLDNDIYMTALGCNNGLNFGFNKGYFSIACNNTITELKVNLEEKYVSNAKQTANNRELIVDGYKVVDSKASKSNNIYLFGLNDNDNMYMGLGKTSNTPAPLKGRIGKVEFYISEELKRNFIPCYRKSDNVIGMYDLVEEKFYTNQGNGEFSKGRDIN